MPRRIVTAPNSFNAMHRVTVSLVAALILFSPSATADAQARAGGRTEVFAGSTFESYLRYLQTLDKASFEPWSIRGFALTEVDARAPRDTTHPWHGRYRFHADSAPVRIDFVRPTGRAVFNTAFPFGGNDGPVWAGKGATAVFQAGITAEFGPVSLRLAPVAFTASNSEFPLFPNGEEGSLRFAHGQFPRQIDLPQRFGEGVYTRIDPGESTLRIEGLGIAAGLSTASQWWGPTDMFPYVLGNNAGGFPHAYVGTSKPVDLRLVRFHGRLVYGRTSQTEYSPVAGSDIWVNEEEGGTRRIMAGVVAVMQIGRNTGFEFGGSRFFHAPSEGDTPSSDQFGLPFQNLFRRNLPLVEGRENQLGSLFARWAPPGTGFDVYGEYGREDFSADTRDYMMQPEHAATTNIGFRKAWDRGMSINALRAEVFSYEASAGSRTRDEGLVFLHGVLRQGHTHRGQLLSAAVGPGSGNAQHVAFDRFVRSGRFTASYSRVTAHEDRSGVNTGPALDPAVNVMHSLGAEGTLFRGPLDLTAKAVFTREWNRYLQNQDANNLNLGIGVRFAF